MPSDRSLLTRVLAAALLVIPACTERLPIEPVSTTDDDWSPSFRVVWHGYQRVEIQVEGPPRKELLPNIERYVLEAAQWGDTMFLPVDTASYFTPAYITPINPMYWNRWRSDARFEYGAGYDLRLVVHYRTGVTRHNGATGGVRMDAGRGTILTRLPINGVPSGQYGDLGEKLIPWKGNVLFNRGERLYAADTASATVSYLADLLPTVPLEQYDAVRFLHRLRSLGVSGDTLVAALEIMNERRLKLQKVNLVTFSVDSSVVISWPSDLWLEGASVGGDMVALLFRRNAGKNHIRVYRAGDGALLQTYPEGILADYAYERFSFDGTNYWFSWEYYQENSEFNTIRQLNPSTLSFTQVHRNPVYNYRTYACDGTYAWVEDVEGWSLVKVRLEGF